MNNSSLANVSFLFHIDMAGYKIGAPVFASILTLWTTFVNVFLIGVLVTSALRRQLRYKLIVFVSTCDLIMNLMCNPFVVEYSIKGVWVHGCFTQVLIQIMYNFSDLFLQLWYLVLIVAESVFRQMSRNFSTFVTVLIMCLPLICGVVMMPALVLTGIRQVYRDMWTSEYCHVLLTKEREIVMAIACYYIPSLTSAGLLTYAAVRSRLQKRNFSIQNRIILQPSSQSDNLLVFLAPWLAVTLLALPEQIMVILYLSDQLGVTSQVSFDAFVTGSFIDSLSLGILPVTWFLIPEVRDAAKTRREILEAKFRVFWAKTKDNEDASVTYSNLKDDAKM